MDELHASWHCAEAFRWNRFYFLLPGNYQLNFLKGKTFILQNGFPEASGCRIFV